MGMGFDVQTSLHGLWAWVNEWLYFSKLQLHHKQTGVANEHRTGNTAKMTATPNGYYSGYECTVYEYHTQKATSPRVLLLGIDHFGKWVWPNASSFFFSWTSKCRNAESSVFQHPFYPSSFLRLSLLLAHNLNAIQIQFQSSSPTLSSPWTPDSVYLFRHPHLVI